MRLCVLAICSAAISMSACGSGSISALPDTPASSGTGGSIPIITQPSAGSTEPGGPYTLPTGFTQADLGGYELGDPIALGAGGAPPAPGDGGGGEGATDGGGDGATDSGAEGCGTTLLGVVRDFKDDHPDFEKVVADDPGLVKDALGSDKKPVYAPTGATKTVSGATSFDQWYRNTDGINQPFRLLLSFAPNGAVFTFQSTAFFPLDGKGWGNQGRNHNFHFTTEVHTEFRYKGGEAFKFTGDDDLFVFINGKLAIDLGGVHGQETKDIKLDDQAAALGIVKGNIYALDLFHAERHTTESNFRVDTDLEFTNCGEIVPIDVR
jgi:fibro-slime domain-containing protein